MRCITCNKQTFPLCQNCRKNPYFVEKARRFLAEKGDLKNLTALYFMKYAVLKDENTDKFWDLNFSDFVSLDEEESVTKEKIKIVASFIPKNGGKILDIGIGAGFIEEYLLTTQKKVDFHGIDISPKSINFVKKRYKGDFKIGSFYKLPYKPSSFDIVLALDVLEHIPPPKIFGVLRKIRLIIKPRGYFIASVPLNERLWGMEINDSSHMREYSPELLRKELMISGFNPLSSKTIYAFADLRRLKTFAAENLLTNRWDYNELIIKTQKI